MNRGQTKKPTRRQTIENWQPDPEYAEWLRQEQAPLNETDAFLRTYGFEHDCRCAEDYEEGNVGYVSACWANMANDALGTCKELLEKNLELRSKIAQLRAQVTGLEAEPVA